MNLANYFINPHSNFIKKYLFEILKNDYSNHEKFIDRICNQLNIKEDAQSFIELLGVAYRNGYLLASNQYNEKLKEMNINVEMTTNNLSEKNKIFNQKNQDFPEME
jgi:hypothetical protein